jgi:choloylglycine hydrolase
MKLNIVTLVVVLGLTLPAVARVWACSTFVLQNGAGQVYGRNYDWDLDDALVVVNKRGCSKRSISRPGEHGRRATWTAKYGSVTFNQYGREMPMGGMNEAGLVVEAMALSATRYPDPDDRPYVGSATQWRQYLLDTCRTVEEVIATDGKIRVSPKAGGPGMHVLVLDKSGARATIEFIDGQMTVHTGSALPVAVLTNSTYAESLKCLQNSCWAMFYGDSISRFVRAAKRNQTCRAESTDELVTFAFGTLAAVASARTQWRIVYDNQAMKIYFRTRVNNKIRTIDVPAFDFNCRTPVKIMDANADLSGNVTAQFTDYTYDANRELIGSSFRKTSFLSHISDERLDVIARLPERFACR